LQVITFAALLMFQAEAVGDAIGAGILKLIVTILLIAAAIGGLVLFLWLIRKMDKKINK
jgi:hypothetical protein